jgi:cell division protein ZipA
MDADTLRLILIILGALLILGVYLWERRHQADEQLDMVRRGAAGERREPRLGEVDGATAGPLGPAHPEEQGEDLDATLQMLSGLVSENRSAQRLAPNEATSRSSGPTNTQRQEPSAAEAAAKGNYWQAALPNLILQLNISAKDGRFSGPDILRAVQGAGLQAGEMDIFHRHEGRDGNGQVLFSMASMVKPGVFPMQSMEGFHTPGLTLFAQLPGPRDGLSLFSDMLTSARHIASVLGGELQDETHSRLTKQTIEHIRSQIIEHHRQIQVRLAHSKR